MNSDAEILQTLLRDSIADRSLRTAVFSKPVGSAADQPARIDVRPIVLKGQTVWQLAARQNNQEVHRNLQSTDAIQELQALVGTSFRDIRLQTQTGEWIARHSRKGECRLQQVATTASPQAEPAIEPAAASHDRARSYLIPDGIPCPFLIETGIMSRAGRVHAKHYRKFRQINRYVEFIRDIVHHLPQEGPLSVVDFGCGKSYLTFATHHFLSHVLQRDVDIVGLDRRADVIATCNRIATSLDLQGLQFQQLDIASYQPPHQVHLAISLHACDTATDDALAAAVAWQSDVIFAVPCCQHELAAVLPKDRVPLFSNHGILHERFASLATDALRAALMSAAGYDTQVMEFIDMEHTAKNLLIRAVRRRTAAAETRGSEISGQITDFSELLGVLPLRLQQKLAESNTLSLKIEPSHNAVSPLSPKAVGSV